MPLSILKYSEEKTNGEEVSFDGSFIHINHSKCYLAIPKKKLNEDDFIKLAKSFVSEEDQLDGEDIYLSKNTEKWYPLKNVTPEKKLTLAKNILDQYCKSEEGACYLSALEEVVIPIQKSIYKVHKQYSESDSPSKSTLRKVKPLLELAQNKFNQLKSADIMERDIIISMALEIKKTLNKIVDIQEKANKILQPLEEYLQLAKRQLKMLTVKTPPAHYKRLAAIHGLKPKKSQFVNQNTETLAEIEHWINKAHAQIEELKSQEISEDDLKVTNVKEICEHIKSKLGKLLGTSHSKTSLGSRESYNSAEMLETSQEESKENSSRNQTITNLYQNVTELITYNQDELKREYPIFSSQFNKLIRMKTPTTTKLPQIIQLASDSLSTENHPTPGCCGFFTKVKKITPCEKFLELLSTIDIDKISEDKVEEFLQQCQQVFPSKSQGSQASQ